MKSKSNKSKKSEKSDGSASGIANASIINQYQGIAEKNNLTIIEKGKANINNTYIADHSSLLSVAQEYLKNQNPYQNVENFIKTANLAYYAIPQELRSALWDFKTYGNQSGYFHLKSLPSDPNLMDTPEDTQIILRNKKTFISEFWLSMFGSFLGDPFGYIQENNGNLFHNVRPTKKNADKLSSESSKVVLDLHSETAFHPIIPDFLILYCLRGDRTQEATTFVSSIRDVVPLIGRDLDKTLRSPLFRTGIDYSFGSDNGIKGNGPILSILYGDPKDTLMIFDPDLMLGITGQAIQAIKQLKELLDSKTQSVFLNEGDLLIIDNLRSVHGRNKFKAFFDGQDRWLQRLYVSRNLQYSNKLLDKRERIITHVISTDKKIEANTNQYNTHFIPKRSYSSYSQLFSGGSHSSTSRHIKTNPNSFFNRSIKRASILNSNNLNILANFALRSIK